VVVLGFIFPYILAFSISSFTRSLVINNVYRTFSVISLTLLSLNSIMTVSIKSAEPVHKIENPVAEYFQNTPLPKGSVYYQNDSEVSYFAPNIRLVGSYNDHLLPSPISLRFKNLMRADFTFAGVAPKHKKLIESYSQVLGVEYLFLPKNSPLISVLTSPDTTNLFMIEAPEIISGNEYYSVLKSTKEIHLAYLLTPAQANYLGGLKTLPLPTLKANSYQVWDDQITDVAEKLAGFDTSVELKLDIPDQFTIELGNLKSEPGSKVLVMENYDDNWHSQVATNSQTITPTNLRFMLIDAPSNSQSVTLVNSWPNWHWPVQFLGIFTVLGTVYSLATYQLIQMLRSKFKKLNWLMTNNLNLTQYISHNLFNN